ncbi:MAG: S8 family peptidase [Mycoplasmatales bacterium]
MNDLLELKGRFEQRNNSLGRPIPALKKGAIVNSEKIEVIYTQLEDIYNYWENNDLIEGSLVSIKYNKIAAKRNRVSGIFKDKTTANDKVVGAKYSDDNKHIITYYMSLETLEKTINNLKFTQELLKQKFESSMNEEKFDNNKLFKNISKDKNGISKSLFRDTITDIPHIEKFTIEKEQVDDTNSKIVTLYKTNESTKKLLERIGINVLNERILDDTTVLLGPDDLKILNLNVPFLISQSVVEFNETYLDNFSNPLENKINIPDPENEPTIGVIDTLFDNRVYFSKWVEYEQRIDDSIPIEANDYKHGTAISSIIVDGPRMNPWLEDGCGRFKVKHFGIALNKGFNAFTVIREIEQIIIKNRNIKVWNISLGSNEEINNNFISAEAAILDSIQYENDVIFVIAGTNKDPSIVSKKIGAPADSINSIVVNSVKKETNESTNYTREGLVLSFFIKPDVSYYGGDSNNKISVCEPLGQSEVSGTSFAAPWISRKLSYLIDIMGFNREIAKSLIIDCAIGWEQDLETEVLQKKGHGVVPIHIEEIIKSKDDEIKFVVSGISEAFDTYNYKFPVPMLQEKYPFVAKATLCYFPKYSRTQGVDYINTELDIYFGRLTDNGLIKSINENKQSTDDSVMYEKDARRIFRKWDTVKHITDKKTKNNPQKSYKNKL